MHQVAIIGASWAGLACAIAAAAAGAQVDVYEQRPAMLAEPPVHIGITPNLMRALASLGLAEACVRQGFPYRSMALIDASGRLRTELEYARLAGPQRPAAAGLTRQAFSDVLLAAAQARGVRLHWGEPVTAAELADAARPDLLLLAHADTRPADTITWWSGLIRRPAGLDQLTCVLAAPRSKALLVPLSGSLAGLTLIDAQLQARPEVALSAEQTRQWLRAHGPRLAELVGLVGDDVTLSPRYSHLHLHSGPWQHAGLLRVGPAAYQLPPHFGQAIAQGFEDGVVLGELLTAGLAPEQLPATFEQRRRPRVQAVFDIASRAARWDMAPDGSTSMAELVAAMDAAVQDLA